MFVAAKEKAWRAAGPRARDDFHDKNKCQSEHKSDHDGFHYRTR
jgi:hypothetical protein